MTDLPKLVRDKIPEIIRDNGEKPEVRRIDEEEAEQWIRKKVLEEAREFEEDGELEELADLYAVIQAYIENQEIPISELEELEEEKAGKRGGFEHKIVLEKVED